MALNRHTFRFPTALATLVAALVSSSSVVSAQAVRTGRIATVYAENCASCHGDKMQGAQAPSMLDDIWINGGDDESPCEQGGCPRAHRRWMQ